MPEKRTTDRLFLRQISSRDVSAIPQSWFDLARFLTRVTRPDTLKVAFAFSASTFARLCKITAQHAVTLNARVMGVISATDVPGHCYGTPYRGQGSATKAKRLMPQIPSTPLMRTRHAPGMFPETLHHSMSCVKSNLALMTRRKPCPILTAKRPSSFWPD